MPIFTKSAGILTEIAMNLYIKLGGTDILTILSFCTREHGVFLQLLVIFKFFVSFSHLKVKVTQWCPTLCALMDYTLQRISEARIWKWVAVPFSRGSSQPQSQTQVSRIAGRFFTSWTTREAQSRKPLPSPVP